MVENNSKTNFILKIVIILFILLGMALALTELGLNAWTQLKGG